VNAVCLNDFLKNKVEQNQEKDSALEPLKPVELFDKWAVDYESPEN